MNGVILDVTGVVSRVAATDYDRSVGQINRFALNQILPVKGMMMNPTGSTQLNFTIQSSLDRLNLASLAAANLELTDVGFLPPQFSKPVEHLTARLALQGQPVDDSATLRYAWRIVNHRQRQRHSDFHAT